MCFYPSSSKFDLQQISTGPDLQRDSLTHLLVQGLVVLEQRLEGLEDFHLAGDPRRGLGLSFHHRHPQTALVARHQTLQVFQQQLQGEKVRQGDKEDEEGWGDG